MSDFLQHLPWKNADVLYDSFLLLEAVGNSALLVLNNNANAKKRGRWVLLWIWMTKASKIIYSKHRCIGICAQQSKVYHSAFINVRQILLSKTRTQNTFWPHKKSINWRFSLDSNVKLGVRILFFLTNWQKNNDAGKFWVREDLFDRILDAKQKHAENFEESVTICWVLEPYHKNFKKVLKLLIFSKTTECWCLISFHWKMLLTLSWLGIS